MPPVFNQIDYFQSSDPHDGALQMAIDELLLSEASGDRVVFRDYSWAEPTTTIGYFGNATDILDSKKPKLGKPLVRRPTGGGLVEHGHGRDFTYSVVTGSAISRGLHLHPRESYRAIHGILAEVLRDFGINASLASDDESGSGGQACFVNPVGDDLMLGGQKIAGAGQKRSRGAILHQGSVQPVTLPAEFGGAFARALAAEVEISQLSSGFLANAEALAADKFRRDSWTRSRSV